MRQVPRQGKAGMHPGPDVPHRKHAIDKQRFLLVLTGGSWGANGTGREAKR